MAERGSRFLEALINYWPPNLCSWTSVCADWEFLPTSRKLDSGMSEVNLADRVSKFGRNKDILSANEVSTEGCKIM
jgi:hypothetical protein